MGLLSRFGRGLTEAAPIFGQMAQASLLQGAEDKKYNRLLEREELKHTRGLEAAELAYTRGSAAAGRKERITFLDTGINLISDQINTEIDGLTQLREDKAAALTPINRQIIDDMIQQSEGRLAKAIETRNRISSMYQKYVDPEGKLGVFSESEEKSIMTDVALINAANLARNEIVGFEGREGPGIGGDTLTTFEAASTIDRAPELIEEQLKDIDGMIVGRAEPLNEKQKQLFRDTVNTYVQARQSRGGLPSSDLSWSGKQETRETKAVDASIADTKKDLRALTPDDVVVMRDIQHQSISGISPVMISDWGPFRQWLGKAGAWTAENLGRVPFAAVKEWLRSRDRNMLEQMGIDPDAPPVGFEGVDPDKYGAQVDPREGSPSAEDAIAMMFTMPQRV